MFDMFTLFTNILTKIQPKYLTSCLAGMSIPLHTDRPQWYMYQYQSVLITKTCDWQISHQIVFMHDVKTHNGSQYGGRGEAESV